MFGSIPLAVWSGHILPHLTWQDLLALSRVNRACYSLAHSLAPPGRLATWRDIQLSLPYPAAIDVACCWSNLVSRGGANMFPELAHGCLEKCHRLVVRPAGIRWCYCTALTRSVLPALPVCVASVDSARASRNTIRATRNPRHTPDFIRGYVPCCTGLMRPTFRAATVWAVVEERPVRHVGTLLWGGLRRPLVGLKSCTYRRTYLRYARYSSDRRPSSSYSSIRCSCATFQSHPSKAWAPLSTWP